MQKKTNNYAFIDSQNLNLGIQKLGWKLDYRKFRIYLAEKYSVTVAYLFIGFVPGNQPLYDRLQKAGFVLHFKPTVPDHTGSVKGNVDADIVLRAVTEMSEYDKAVIVSSDGDFYSLVAYLLQHDRLRIVLSPDSNNCSTLLKKSAQGNLRFLEQMRDKLSYTKEKARRRDETQRNASS